MDLNELRPDEGSTKRRRRVGRGYAAGQGKTAGRGTKGQKARSGGTKPPYFEGGQLPLVRRLPFKRGFTNPFRIEYQEVNVDHLEDRFEGGETVTPEVLEERGLIRDKMKPVKILGRGEISINLTVQAHGFTKSAKAKIEDAGGATEELELLLDGPQATIKRPKKEVIESLYAEKYGNDS